MLDYDSGDNVSIRVNERFYFIFVLSGYHFFVRDNETPVYCLEKNTAEEKLGEMLKLALSQCRIIDPYENSDFFDRKRIDEDYKEWVGDVLIKCKFKSIKSLFLNMMSCSIKRINGNIILQPSLHKKLKDWTRDGYSDDDDIILPDTVTNAELGKAIKEVLSRCRSVVK
ncbi:MULTISPECIES: contact-dependent growth inhibition system immunity protein [Providencia]|nr:MULTISPECIES: contact-dependent growth inhibition system immunity protein [Providencia]MRF66483.1 DUF1436 family protein [Escherichia coli]QKG45586.1 CdiI family contact-dependent growth inhibition immunity protein [Providencia rettgeri]QNN31822.1 CdiI family contact-dependent growth inhibition immunity protein [Providencia rettgeri]QXA56600.1 CdiI family contact-dependent growth inhibition immunity protein [Providencia rettgeri]BBV04978.1 hypothetical protein BML2531_27540 [Providencia ret